MLKVCNSAWSTAATGMTRVFGIGGHPHYLPEHELVVCLLATSAEFYTLQGDHIGSFAGTAGQGYMQEMPNDALLLWSGGSMDLMVVDMKTLLASYSNKKTTQAHISTVLRFPPHPSDQRPRLRAFHRLHDDSFVTITDSDVKVKQWKLHPTHLECIHVQIYFLFLF